MRGNDMQRRKHRQELMQYRLSCDSKPRKPTRAQVFWSKYVQAGFKPARGEAFINLSMPEHRGI